MALLSDPFCRWGNSLKEVKLLPFIYWQVARGRGRIFNLPLTIQLGVLGGSAGKNLLVSAGDSGFDPWVWKIPWRRKCHPVPVFLPGKSQGQRSLAGYSSWGCKESDTTEWLNWTELMILFPYHNSQYMVGPLIRISWQRGNIIEWMNQ